MKTLKIQYQRIKFLIVHKPDYANQEENNQKRKELKNLKLGQKKLK